jgi:hypothetical protein
MAGKQNNRFSTKTSDAKKHQSIMEKPRKQHGSGHPPTLGGPAVIIAVGKPKASKKGAR